MIFHVDLILSHYAMIADMEVFLIAAMTVDGKIARHQDERSFDWTSLEDKQFYIKQIKTADAIVMGRKSFNTFTRYPKHSRWIIYTSQPKEFVNPRPEVITAEGTNESPGELIKRLESEGCQRVAICGGASVYTAFMGAGLVTKLYLTVEPVLFGGGVPLFGEMPQKNLQLLHHEKLNESTLMLEYQVLS